MNEELAKKLAEAIDGVMAWAESAGAFAADQAPLVVQEILAWTLWSSVAEIVLSALTMLIIVLVMRRFADPVCRAWRMEDGYDNAGLAIGGFVGGVVGAVFLVAGLVTIYDKTLLAVQVLVAPRLVIIETLKGLS